MNPRRIVLRLRQRRKVASGRGCDAGRRAIPRRNLKLTSCRHSRRFCNRPGDCCCYRSKPFLIIRSPYWFDWPARMPSIGIQTSSSSGIWISPRFCRTRHTALSTQRASSYCPQIFSNAKTHYLGLCRKSKKRSKLTNSGVFSRTLVVPCSWLQ